MLMMQVPPPASEGQEFATQVRSILGMMQGVGGQEVSRFRDYCIAETLLPPKAMNKIIRTAITVHAMNLDEARNDL
jgi:hypothetical protein